MRQFVQLQRPDPATRGDPPHASGSPAGPETTPEQALELYRLMVLSRSIENRLHALYQQGRLRGRLISGRGQEAIPVGFAAATEPGDIICPVHRDLGAHLARRTTPEEVFLHYLGRETSASAGRDGDIHFGVWRKGVFPMISHLPDSWPIAVGMALADSLDSCGGVVVAFCGDGATSVGAWHEAINMASVWQTPNVFVIENNQFAYSTPTDRQFRVASLSDRASAYGIPGETIDGNDAELVFATARRAIDRARQGGGPILIEAITMRMDGHASHDPAKYVPKGLLEAWRQRDPIDLLANRLLARSWANAESLKELADQCREQVDAAYESAAAAPLPDAGLLEVGVFASPGPEPVTVREFCA